ncbi:dUTP diphosphatase [candidate division WOR-3 bacterium]|nr:dUTP diphosphatase [candidate division WOR-3 bacterium]
MQFEIKYALLHPLALPPEYKSEEAAGADLKSCEDAVILPGEWKAVRTGIALEIPEGYHAEIRPRSGLALKHGITVLNSPGTVDSDYRGEVMVILINYSGRDFQIRAGDRIAQMVVTGSIRCSFAESGSLRETGRGDGGFGHTGLS